MPLLSQALEKTMMLGSNLSKKSMILVQITGTLRNLLNLEESNLQIANFSIISKLINALSYFKGHKELTLNISRILSKLSIDYQFAAQMCKTTHLQTLVEILEQHKDNSAILIRIAFVLGNLTTHFEDVRFELSNQLNALEISMKIALFYLDKDA